MPSFKASSTKKMDVSFSNWVLGGSLVSVIDAETVNKHGKKSRHRKAFITKPDGTVQEIEEPQCPHHNHDAISIELAHGSDRETPKSKSSDKSKSPDKSNPSDKSKSGAKTQHKSKHDVKVKEKKKDNVKAAECEQCKAEAAARKAAAKVDKPEEAKKEDGGAKKEEEKAAEPASTTGHEKTASPKKDEKNKDKGDGESKKKEGDETKKVEDKKDEKKSTEASTNKDKPSDEKPSAEKPFDEKPSEDKSSANVKASEEELKSTEPESKSDESKSTEPESAESKPDETKSDDTKDKSTKEKKNGVEFTAEQDATILSMKGDNKSWKDIMTALNITNKSAIMARFRELKSNTETEEKVSSPKPAETEIAATSDDKSEEKEAGKNSPVIDIDFGMDLFGADSNVGTSSNSKKEDTSKKEKEEKSKKEDKSKKGDNSKSKSKEKEVAFSPEPVIINPTPKNDADFEKLFDSPSVDPKDKDLYRKLQELLAGGADIHSPEVAEKLDRVMEVYNKYTSGGETTDAEPDTDTDVETKEKDLKKSKTVYPQKTKTNGNTKSKSKSKFKQNWWMDSEDERDGLGIWTRSQPKNSKLDLKKNLIPDDTWSKDDCELLEHLMERYENEKWLHMQANFYNWTGRMVNAEIIEGKFRKDMEADE